MVVAVNEPRESVPLSVVVEPHEPLLLELLMPVKALSLSVTVLLSCPSSCRLAQTIVRRVVANRIAAVVRDGRRFAPRIEVLV